MQNQLFQVTAKSLSYELPRGEMLFSDISFTWNFRRCALVGPNGVGKSTLAKIIAGILRPASGDLLVDHKVLYLAQLQDRPSGTVAEYLMALWESPLADSALWGPLLQDVPLERPVTELSGGEWTRVRIAETLSQGAGLLILDEPTNNLDREARVLIRDFVRRYSGALLVISHDRELLEEVDGIWELSSQGLQSYGGPYSEYEEQKSAERELLADRIDRVRREKKKVEREHQEKLRTQEKRMRVGQALADKGGLPRIIVGGLKRRAQETHGKIQAREEKRVEKSKEELGGLIQSQKSETRLGLDLTASAVPEGKLIFELQDFNLRYENQNFLWSEPLTVTMRGPQRWALSGRNGAGKSSLIKALLGQMPVCFSEGTCRLGEVQVRLLDQQYSLLNPELSVLENILEQGQRDPVQVRNQLARFQFMREMVHRQVRDLSGGEKLKAALAKIFLSDPAAQFLILDEPTNNLDLDSLQVLETALLDYRGALLVVSHDERFLQAVEVSSRIELNGRNVSR
ncbi:ATP-binding cassette domain-containing protein [Bdellovibrio bacteriovorus]|uniref:ABC-F family ATP-binding cassette domain-containing protein n=1 Tax=Bdellovibrio bacteriovorus TaxID=959 RepID=UPI0021D2E5B3|nr:ABC-F family ATP-binding cassette domain-containing protein [Bdellovibrio bacteriovorus]UXR64119.1 ATP-binding cassette domain-containing protein [Bdellovibrio bacteriovorus]